MRPLRARFKAALRLRAPSFVQVLGVGGAVAAAIGLVWLCWVLTPAFWSTRFPVFLMVGFYGLCGMLIGLLAVLIWQLLQAPQPARARRAEW